MEKREEREGGCGNDRVKDGTEKMRAGRISGGSRGLKAGAAWRGAALCVSAGYERATSAHGDRAYRIRVDRLCVSTKRFNTRRVTDSSRRSLPLQPHSRVASTCAARLRLIYGRGATLFPKIPTSVAEHRLPPSLPTPTNRLSTSRPSLHPSPPRARSRGP